MIHPQNKEYKSQKCINVKYLLATEISMYLIVQLKPVPLYLHNIIAYILYSNPIALAAFLTKRKN